MAIKWGRNLPVLESSAERSEMSCAIRWLCRRFDRWFHYALYYVFCLIFHSYVGATRLLLLSRVLLLVINLWTILINGTVHTYIHAYMIHPHINTYYIHRYSGASIWRNIITAFCVCLLAESFCFCFCLLASRHYDVILVSLLAKFESASK